MSVNPRVLAGAAAAVATVAIGVAAKLAGPHEGTLYKAYRDPIGIWTICRGHTRGVHEGMRATEAQCEEWFQTDLAEANAIVDGCITAPMTIGQRAAMIDFAFNVGPGRTGVKDGLCVLKNGNQPQIRRKANAGDWQGACDALMDWTRAGGQVFKGLVRRRADARAVCLSDYFANVVSGSSSTAWSNT